MVSAGQVSSHLSDVTTCFTNYNSLIDGLQSAWTGSSHDGLQSKASAFSSEYLSSITSQMNTFIEAIGLYEQYINAKRSLETARSNYNTAVYNKDNSSAGRFASEINYYSDQVSNLKTQIESCLSAVSGIHLEGAPNNAGVDVSGGSSTSVGGDITFQTTRFANTTVWYSVISKDNMPKLAVANDNYDKVTNEAPSSIAKRNNAVLGINFCITGEDAQGMLYTNGKLVHGETSNGGETLYMTQDGRLDSVTNRDHSTEDILALNPVWASKGFKAIVRDGEYCGGDSSFANARHPRTFIGQDYDGNYIVGVCTGRQNNESGWTYQDIYNFVTQEVSSNVRFLYNADGGGSSAFIYEGEKQNPNTDKSERVRPDLIYWTE